MSLLKSFCLKAGGLRTYNATTVNPLRKISYGFFSILAALKPNFPNVAYVSTGGKASITLSYLFENLDKVAFGSHWIICLNCSIIATVIGLVGFITIK